MRFVVMKTEIPDSDQLGVQEIKAMCRSNIVERAHLTAEEERDIFEYLPYWYYRVMGIKQKKKETR